MPEVNEQGNQTEDQQKWREKWGDSHSSRIFFFLAIEVIKCGKKQDAGSKPPQKKIQGNLPVPDIQLWIHQVFMRPLTIISSLMVMKLFGFKSENIIVDWSRLQGSGFLTSFFSAQPIHRCLGHPGRQNKCIWSGKQQRRQASVRF